MHLFILIDFKMKGRYSMSFDTSIIKFISEHGQNPILDKLFLLISWISNVGLVWFMIAAILLVNKRYRIIGMMLILSLVVSLTLGELILKDIVQRPRPFMEITNIHLLVTGPKSYSFPSVHTAMAFAALGIIIKTIRNRLFVLLAVLLACLVAFSRLYLMVHYPTDVLGGILVGLASAAVVYKSFNRAGKLEEKF